MQLRMRSAYHPQSDSQTKVLNRVIEQCLRAFVHGRPQEWGKFLLWVEWSHNTSWIAATGTTPFKITFGCIPFNFPEYIAGSSTLDVVDKMLTNREETFQAIRKKLLRAQERMKLTANTKRREVTYQPGDWEMLKLHSYRQVSAKWAQATWGKLAKRFYRPFQVLERIGPVAYRLKLSKEAHIHSVFHCSLLKTFKGSPDCILKAELPSQFVQPDDTSWENWEQLCEDYHLEDKVNFQGPTDDTKEEEITSRGKKDIQTRMQKHNKGGTDSS